MKTVLLLSLWCCISNSGQVPNASGQSAGRNRQSRNGAAGRVPPARPAPPVPAAAAGNPSSGSNTPPQTTACEFLFPDHAGFFKLKLFNSKGGSYIFMHMLNLNMQAGCLTVHSLAD